MTREEAIRRFENVKASALVQKASGVSEYWQNEIDGTIEAIDMAIESLQTDIVRCKDCRHSRVYQTDSKGTMQTYCVAFIMSRTVTNDDFCSWGERR